MISNLTIRLMINSTNRPAALRTRRSPIALSRRLYQIAVARAAEVQEGLGIVPLEFAILIHLNASPGIDQNTLAARLALDRTSTGALVHGLEKKGLVTRAVSSTDRRARVLKLTAKGAALHAKLRPKGEAAQAEILSVLSAGRAKVADRHARARHRGQRSVRPPGRRTPQAITAGDAAGAR